MEPRSAPPMLTGAKESDSPQEILMGEIRAAFTFRHEKRFAEADLALENTLICIEPKFGPVKLEHDPGDGKWFSATMRAVLKIMDKHKLWLRTPREVPEGEEWLEAYQ